MPDGRCLGMKHCCIENVGNGLDRSDVEEDIVLPKNRDIKSFLPEEKPSDEV